MTRSPGGANLDGLREEGEMSASTPMVCRLHELLGRMEACSTTACGLWEPGDPGQDGRCAVADLDLGAWPEAAGLLLRVGKEIETASGSAEREAASRDFTEARALIARLSRSPRRH